MKNFISVPFSGKLTRDVPQELLQLPLLSRAEGLVHRQEGAISSANGLNRLTDATFPSESLYGRPIKIFTLNNSHLFGVTDKAFMIYDPERVATPNERKWKILSRRRNMGVNIFPISQKEKDIRYPAFTEWNDILVLIYEFEGQLLYKLFSTLQDRVLDEEKVLYISGSGAKNLNAYTEYGGGNVPKQVWLGVGRDTSIRIQSFLPLSGLRGPGATFNYTLPGGRTLEDFVIYPDLCRYRYRTTPGGALQEDTFAYNPASTETRRLSLYFNSLPTEHAISFENKTLWDFYEWTRFDVGTDQFKVLWSVQTGFFIINSLNVIVGHYHANFVPLDKSDNDVRMNFRGRPRYIESKDQIYFPILKTGQAEEVGRGQVIYPLGLELVCLDFSGRFKPDVSDIGGQVMISGPVNSYTDEQNVVEAGFSEKPKIAKTPTDDYDRSEYGDLLEVEIPPSTVENLAADEFKEVDLEVTNAKTTPYTTENAVFTAQTVGNTVGIANREAGWSDGTGASKRILRASDTKTLPGGKLTNVYYDTAKKVLVWEVTPPTGGYGDQTRPQGLLLAGENDQFFQLYENHVNYTKASPTLHGSYHAVATSPLVSGRKYKAKLAGCVFYNKTAINETVVEGTTENSQTDVRVDRMSLRKFSNQSGRETTVQNPASSLSQAVVQSAVLRTGDTMEVDPSLPPVFDTNLTVPNPSNDHPSIVIGSKLFWSRYSSNRFNLTISDLDGSNARVLYTSSNSFTIFTDGTDIYILSRRSTNVLVFNGNTGVSKPSITLSGRDLGSSLFGMTASSTHILISHDLDQRRGERLSLFTKSGVFVRDIEITESEGGSRRYEIIKNSGIKTRDSFLVYIRDRKTIYQYSASGVLQRTKTLTTSDSSISFNYIQAGISNDDKIIIEFVGERLSVQNIYTGVFNISDLNARTQITPQLGILLSLSNDYLYILGGNPQAVKRYTINAMRTVQRSKEEGYLKTGYAARVGASTLTPAGQIASAVVNNIELTGIWNDADNNTLGSNLYVAFSTASSNFGTVADFKTEVEARIGKLRFLQSSLSYEVELEEVPAGDVQTYNLESTYTVRYNLKAALASSQILKNIITEAITNSTAFRIALVGHASTDTSSNFSARDIQPIIFSMNFSSAKDLRANDTAGAVDVYLTTDRSKRNNFVLPSSSFIEVPAVPGDSSGRKTYYKKTIANPLPLTTDIFAFTIPPPTTTINVTLRYPLVVTSEQQSSIPGRELLRIKAYQYRCRFKWVDQKGFEHRSQWSDIISLFTKSQLGVANNQPTFEINNLHLTNKPEDSITIEVYRTEEGLNTFKLLKELKNSKDTEKQIFTDDVVDKDLGATETPNNITVSGAAHVIDYKGRFVLFGFPEKKNRIMVSSPIRSFTNQAIDFKNSGLPNDLVEILMDNEVRSVREMDRYLVIHTSKDVYSWVIDENRLAQATPEKITGLINLSARDSQSSHNIPMGMLFSTEDRGIWVLRRGLTPDFLGKDVRGIYKGKIISMDVLKDTEEIRILTDNDDNPVLVYNYRFGKWTVLNWPGYVAASVLNNRYTLLASNGFIYQERNKELGDDVSSVISNRQVLETGWLNFKAVQDFQRFMEVILLAHFRGLESLSLTIWYDFKDVASEVIQADLSGFTDSPAQNIPGTNPSLGTSLSELRQFRFQPRIQLCSAVKLRWSSFSKEAQFQEMKLGVNVKPSRGSVTRVRQLPTLSP